MNRTVFSRFVFGFAAAVVLVFFCGAGVSQAGAIVDYEGIDSVHVAKESPESGKSITVGAGIAVVPDYEGSDYYEIAPLLHFRMAWANGRYSDFSGNRAKFNVMKDSKLSIGPMVRVRQKRDSDVEDAQVSRMWRMAMTVTWSA